MTTLLEEVSQGKYDDYLIKQNGGADLWEEVREATKEDELREVLPVNMSRMARRAYRDRNWRAIGGTFYSGGSFDLARIQKLIWYLFRNNWLCSNVIENLTFLTMGGGFGVEWEDDNGRNKWKEISEKVGWQFYQRDIIRATFAYGEWFTVLLPASNYSNAEPQNKIKTDLCGIDPWEITDIGKVKGNPRRIEYYEQEDGTRYHPQDIIHHRVKYVGNYDRGLPIVLPVLDPMYWGEKCLQNQHWLHHIRSRIPAVRKVMGGASEVSSEEIRTGTLPKPGTIFIENEGTEWQFPDLNIGAVDSEKTYRQFVLAVAEGSSLPDFLVMASAENRAYASLLAQESPAVQKIVDYQQIFKTDFRRIIQALTGRTDFRVTPPPVVQRDLKEQVEAFTMLYDRGAISKETLVKKAGLDWEGPDGEKVKLASEGYVQGKFIPDEEENSEVVLQQKTEGTFTKETIEALKRIVEKHERQ